MKTIIFGISFLLFILFLILKLCGVINWNLLFRMADETLGKIT
jgi:hypothetical protein